MSTRKLCGWVTDSEESDDTDMDTDMESDDNDI